MSKSQVLIIMLLLIGIAGFGFLAYQKWQDSQVTYAFGGYVYQVSGNKIIVDAPLPTQENGKTILKTKRITVDTTNSTFLEHINANQTTSSARLSDIHGQDTSLISTQINVFTKTDPKLNAELKAYKIDIIKDSQPLPQGVNNSSPLNRKP